MLKRGNKTTTKYHHTPELCAGEQQYDILFSTSKRCGKRLPINCRFSMSVSIFSTFLILYSIMILKTDCERCYDKEVKDTTYNNQILFNQT